MAKHVFVVKGNVIVILFVQSAGKLTQLQRASYNKYLKITHLKKTHSDGKKNSA